MPDEEQVWLGKELERLAMQPDTIVNVTLEGGDGGGQESVSAETGVGPAENGTTASVGNSG
jgi:hypothetical protein